MRHGKSGRKFSLEASERKAFFRNITDSLIVKGKIKTTVTRAKEIRKFAEQLVTMAKEGTLASKRRALAFLRTKEAFVKLFGEYALAFKDRNGGYTRITKAGYRAGDNAPMAYLEFIVAGEEPTAKKAAPKRKRRRSTKNADGDTEKTGKTKGKKEENASTQE